MDQSCRDLLPSAPSNKLNDWGFSSATLKQEMTPSIPALLLRIRSWLLSNYTYVVIAYLVASAWNNTAAVTHDRSPVVHKHICWGPGMLHSDLLRAKGQVFQDSRVISVNQLHSADHRKEGNSKMSGCASTLVKLADYYPDLETENHDPILTAGK